GYYLVVQRRHRCRSSITPAYGTSVRGSGFIRRRPSCRASGSRRWSGSRRPPAAWRPAQRTTACMSSTPSRRWSPMSIPIYHPRRAIAFRRSSRARTGHFDHYPVDSREFVTVHVYGSLRRVLDIFESYIGRPIPWQFRESYEKLELIPLIEWEN